MTLNNRSQFDIMFFESLRRGYIDCAKQLYQHVTNISIISIKVIIHDMISIIKRYSEDGFENMDSLLQRYYDVFEFLVDIGFVCDLVNDTPQEVFLINYDTYQIVSTHPIYYKITELIYQMMNFDKTKILSSVVQYKLIGGLFLLSDMNVLEASDFEFSSVGFYVKHVDKLIRLLAKHQSLTNANLQQFMDANLYTIIYSSWNQYDFDNELWTNYNKRFYDLISFIKDNGFRFVITDEMRMDYLLPNAYQKLLNSGMEWQINKPIMTDCIDSYELLQRNNIDVVLQIESGENESANVENELTIVEK